jgi:hypothetical protein
LKDSFAETSMCGISPESQIKAGHASIFVQVRQAVNPRAHVHPVEIRKAKSLKTANAANQPPRTQPDGRQVSRGRATLFTVGCTPLLGAA